MRFVWLSLVVAGCGGVGRPTVVPHLELVRCERTRAPWHDEIREWTRVARVLQAVEEPVFAALARACSNDNTECTDALVRELAGLKLKRVPAFDEADELNEQSCGSFKAWRLERFTFPGAKELYGRFVMLSRGGFIRERSLITKASRLVLDSYMTTHACSFPARDRPLSELVVPGGTYVVENGWVDEKKSTFTIHRCPSVSGFRASHAAAPNVHVVGSHMWSLVAPQVCRF